MSVAVLFYYQGVALIANKNALIVHEYALKVPSTLSIRQPKATSDDHASVPLHRPGAAGLVRQLLMPLADVPYN